MGTIIGYIIKGIIIIAVIWVIGLIAGLIFKAFKGIKKIKIEKDKKKGIYRVSPFSNETINFNEDGFWGDAEHRVHLNLTNITRDDDEKLDRDYIAIRPCGFKKGNIVVRGEAINNLYLTNLEGEDSYPVGQIDEIVISQSAIFMIECKTYTGKVEVYENQKYWKCNGHEVYSPVRQNAGHINLFRKICLDKMREYENSDKEQYNAWKIISNMPIYNIICFSDKTIVNECNKTDYSIVKVKNIKEFLTRLAIKSYKETGNIDSSIFNVLSYYLRDCFKCVGDETMKAHLEMAKKKDKEL